MQQAFNTLNNELTITSLVKTIIFELTWKPPVLLFFLYFISSSTYLLLNLALNFLAVTLSWMGFNELVCTWSSYLDLSSLIAPSSALGRPKAPSEAWSIAQYSPHLANVLRMATKRLLSFFTYIHPTEAYLGILFMSYRSHVFLQEVHPCCGISIALDSFNSLDLFLSSTKHWMTLPRLQITRKKLKCQHEELAHFNIYIASLDFEYFYSKTISLWLGTWTIVVFPGGIVIQWRQLNI